MLKKNLLQYCTVLYAEDDAMMRESMSKTLGYFFESVVLAKDGEEAFKKFKELQPHVIILDVDMPKSNGLEVATKIREINQNIPILILTVHNESTKILQSFEFGAINWLVKPLSIDNLIATLEKCEKVLIKNAIGFIKLSENIVYNSFTKTISGKGKNIILSFSEATVFEILLKNRGQIIHQNTIEASLFESIDFSSTALKNAIYRLRKKLPILDISCISKTGYILK